MDDSALDDLRRAGRSEMEAAADRAALSAILEAHGRDSEAREALRQAVVILERVLGEDHYEVGVAIDQLAAMVTRAGDSADGAALYGRALGIFEKTLGRTHPRTVTCRTNRDKALTGSHP